MSYDQINQSILKQYSLQIIFLPKRCFVQILQPPGALAISLSYTQDIISQPQCGKVLRCPQNQSQGVSKVRSLTPH